MPWAGLDNPKLGEGHEHDPRSAVQRRLEDLDHRHLSGAEFKDPAASAGRRVIDRLGERDEVELGYTMSDWYWRQDPILAHAIARY